MLDIQRLIGLIGVALTGILLAVSPLALADRDEDDDRHRGRHGKKQKVEEYRDGCKYEFEEHSRGYKKEYKCEHGRFRGRKYDYESKYGGCEYKYEENEHGYKEEYKCKSAAAYRRTPRHARVDDEARHPPEPREGGPYGVSHGKCNRELAGQVVGGVVGAVIGAKVGDKTVGREVGAVGGAIVGILVGGQIGKRMERKDQSCVGQALEHAIDQRSVNWQDDKGTEYYVTPVRSFTDLQGRDCREFDVLANFSGTSAGERGTACRNQEGAWQRIN